MSLLVRMQILVWADASLERWNHDGLARPYWRIYANDQPGWSVRWRGGSHELDPTRVVLIAPETRYDGVARGPSRHRFLHATATGAGLEVPPGIWSFPRDALFTELLPQGSGPDRQWAAMALLTHAFARLPADVWSPSAESPAVAAALQVLRGRTDGGVSSADLIRAAGCPGYTLVRRFRTEMGLTPHAWHLRQRIALACLDLERTAETIEAIAERFGFCDRHHFSRTFRRWRGVTPAAYRASNLGQGLAP